MRFTMRTHECAQHRAALNFNDFRSDLSPGANKTRRLVPYNEVFAFYVAFSLMKFGNLFNRQSWDVRIEEKMDFIFFKGEGELISTS